MSFGKNPQNLDNVGTTQQQNAAFEASRNRGKGGGGGGGGGKPYFVDSFKPSMDAPDTVRLLKGSYDVSIGQHDGTLITTNLAWFPFTEHYHGTMKKGFVCSAGPFGSFKGKGQPCLGHEMFWADRNAGRKNGPMSMRDMYSLGVIHYATYASVEQVDYGTGAIRTNNEGKAYMTWVRVHEHEKAKFAGKETVDARQLHWDMGYGHWNTLLEYDKAIGTSCKSCGGVDTVSMVVWHCSACGNPIIEAASTVLSGIEIEALAKNPVTCAACNHHGYMTEFVNCRSCTEGARATLYDVDLKVKRVGDATGKSHQTSLVVLGWSPPRPVDARFADIAVPNDLSKVFVPEKYEKQLEKIGGPSPATMGRSPVTGAGHTVKY